MDFELKHSADGTPYARVYLGTSPVTHKPIRRQKSFRGMSDADALEAARRWVDDLTGNGAREGEKVGPALTRYVDTLKANGNSANTIKTYRMYTRRYAATIARKPIAAVTALDLDELFTHLQTEGAGNGPLSPRTVEGFRAFLSGAFGHYAAVGIIDRNPVRLTLPPQVIREEPAALDDYSIATLIEALEKYLSGEGEEVDATKRNAAFAAYLALHTGARVGEVCGLRRRDVRRPASTIVICGNVAEVTGGPIRQAKTKGKRSRNVTVSADVLSMIAAHITWQRTYLESAGPDTPLCTTTGEYMRPTTISAKTSEIMREVGISGESFHALRHTHATLLLQSGTDFRLVQERLGHARASTTLDNYAHVMPGRDAEAAARIATLLKRGG